MKDMMERLCFFIGDWNLEYKIPKSRFSEAATGTGTGTFRRALKIYFHKERIGNVNAKT